MEGFEPQKFGYKAENVEQKNGCWVIYALNLPVIACSEENLWYCPLSMEYIEMKRSA